jgi:hypothetical protein
MAGNTGTTQSTRHGLAVVKEQRAKGKEQWTRAFHDWVYACQIVAFVVVLYRPFSPEFGGEGGRQAG